MGFDSPRRRGVLPGVSPCRELYQAAAALETATGEKDTDAPTSMGLLKNIPITSGEKTLVLLANYKSDGDGLFQVEPGILAGVSSLSDIQRVKAEMTARTLFRPNGNLLMSVTKTEEISPDTRRLEVSPETCGGENHGQPENRGGAHVLARDMESR